MAAHWYDDAGEPTGEPAIVASDNCVFLTHVMLADDPGNKMQLLLAMAGHLVPKLWGEACGGLIGRIGRFGPYANFAAAESAIRDLAAADSKALQALKEAGLVQGAIEGRRTCYCLDPDAVNTLQNDWTAFFDELPLSSPASNCHSSNRLD